MKKQNFTALILWVIAGMMFAFGMCMVLQPQWNAFVPGIVVGVLGLLMGLITLIDWRRKAGKPRIKVNGKTVFAVIVGIVGTLLFGLGMCLCMVWGKFLLGILAGVVGVIVLLCLIPLTVGLK